MSTLFSLEVTPEFTQKVFVRLRKNKNRTKYGGLFLNAVTKYKL